MKQHAVIKQIEKADKAIVEEDFDTLLDIYTKDAIQSYPLLICQK